MRILKHTIFGVIFVMLVLGLVAGTGVCAKEQKPAAEIKLAADNPVADAQFGRSVALAGDLVAVGEGGDGAVGAVYLFRRHGMTWVPEATLASPDAAPDSYPEFGRTVAIKGNTVFVGARFAQAGDLQRAGAVYIFKKQRNGWLFEDKIVSPAPENEDNFGRAVAVDGNRMVVTARKSSLEEGSAYVFEKKAGKWIYSADLVASDAAPGAYFGQSVDIQGDLIVIGARNANPNEAGAVYFFRKARDGWREFARVAPENGKKNDQFGFTVDIEGKTVAVGARRADQDSLTDAGAVYVYSVKNDAVDLVTRLTPADISAKDEFGQSLAIAGDTLAVGAWKDDNKQGSIYLFRRNRSGWSETGKITASDGVPGDEFGYSLAASGDRMVTGAHFAEAKAGAAYVLPVKQSC